MRIRFRIQRFKVNVDPYLVPIPDPGDRMTKNLKKKVTADKKGKNFNKNSNLLILQPPYRTSTLQEKYSLFNPQKKTSS
jgi:hypothetical protein